MSVEKSDLNKEAGKDTTALMEMNGAPDNEALGVTFLTSEGEEARIRLALDRGVFIGFTKEELLKFEKDPGWKRLRTILLALFWVAWIILLVAAVIVIYRTPPCPGRPTLQWPEKFPIYEINVPTFRIGSRSCSSEEGTIDGVLDVLTTKNNNYFDRLKPANTLWLRGLDFSDSSKYDRLGKKLEPLFDAAKKKQRRLLLDLFPYSVKEGFTANTANLGCTIYSGNSTFFFCKKFSYCFYNYTRCQSYSISTSQCGMF